MCDVCGVHDTHQLEGRLDEMNGRQDVEEAEERRPRRSKSPLWSAHHAAQILESSS